MWDYVMWDYIIGCIIIVACALAIYASKKLNAPKQRIFIRKPLREDWPYMPDPVTDPTCSGYCVCHSLVSSRPACPCCKGKKE